LPAEKLQEAQEAANYLEKHDLVRVFQDMLHGLMATRPQDPYAYIDEKVTRARSSLLNGSEKVHPSLDDRCYSFSVEASEVAAPLCEAPVATEAWDVGVDSFRAQKLAALLEADCGQLNEVLSCMPKELVAFITSDDFASNCHRGFAELDESESGLLDMAELNRIVQRLFEERIEPVGADELKRLFGIWDRDRKKTLNTNNFADFARFVAVMSCLTSSLAQSEIATVDGHEKLSRLLRAQKASKGKLGEVVNMLPAHILTPLMSNAFSQSCLTAFGFVPGSVGAVPIRDLAPVLVDLSQKPSAPAQCAISLDQCQHFEGLVDQFGSGAISGEEFVSFARFMLALAYLETTEGRVVADNAEIALSEARVEELLGKLKRDRDTVRRAMPKLPQAVKARLTSGAFESHCRQRFAELDKDSDNILNAQELFPVVVELSEAHPFGVNFEQCERFAAIFSERGDSKIKYEEFLDFAGFVFIMNFLQST